MLRPLTRKERARRYWVRVVDDVQVGAWMPVPLRKALLRAIGCRIGRDLLIMERVHFTGGEVTMEDRSSTGRDSLVDATAPVFMGEGASVGSRVTILTGSHPMRPSVFRVVRAEHEDRPVRIERGAWIGSCATLLPGVTIGEGCVIAAGAVVTADARPNGLYGGVPAKWIRDLPTEGETTPEGLTP